MSTKRALLIGINYLKSTTARLNGCIEDIKNVQTMLIDAYGYPPENIITLRDDIQSKNPTRANILMSFQVIASISAPSDEIWIHYSGHGSQIRDTNNDENDRMDETIVPVDYLTAGTISDDELFNIVRTIRCRAFLVFDSCHSGSVCDLQYTINYVSGSFSRAISSNKSITNSKIVLLSGCRDAQTSADAYDTQANEPGGALTMSLLSCLRKNQHAADIMKIYNDVCYDLLNNRHTQIPVLSSSIMIPTLIFSRPQPGRIIALTIPPNSALSVPQKPVLVSVPLASPSSAVPVKKNVQFQFAGRKPRRNASTNFNIVYH